MGKTEKVEKSQKPKRGGYRPGSGRKPIIPKEQLEEVKALLAQHGHEEHPKLKKPRMLAIMDTLAELAIKGNVPAAKEYFDRLLGKSKESIDHTSKGEQIGVIILPQRNGDTLATDREASRSAS